MTEKGGPIEFLEDRYSSPEQLDEYAHRLWKLQETATKQIPSPFLVKRKPAGRRTESKTPEVMAILRYKYYHMGREPAELWIGDRQITCVERQRQ